MLRRVGSLRASVDLDVEQQPPPRTTLTPPSFTGKLGNGRLARAEMLCSPLMPYLPARDRPNRLKALLARRNHPKDELSRWTVTLQRHLNRPKRPSIFPSKPRKWTVLTVKNRGGGVGPPSAPISYGEHKGTWPILARPGDSWRP